MGQEEKRGALKEKGGRGGEGNLSGDSPIPRVEGLRSEKVANRGRWR